MVQQRLPTYRAALILLDADAALGTRLRRQVLELPHLHILVPAGLEEPAALLPLGHHLAGGGAVRGQVAGGAEAALAQRTGHLRRSEIVGNHQHAAAAARILAVGGNEPLALPTHIHSSKEKKRNSPQINPQ